MLINKNIFITMSSLKNYICYLHRDCFILIVYCFIKNKNIVVIKISLILIIINHITASTIIIIHHYLLTNNLIQKSCIIFDSFQLFFFSYSRKKIYNFHIIQLVLFCFVNNKSLFFKIFHRELL